MKIRMWRLGMLEVIHSVATEIGRTQELGRNLLTELSSKGLFRGLAQLDAATRQVQTRILWRSSQHDPIVLHDADAVHTGRQWEEWCIEPRGRNLPIVVLDRMDRADLARHITFLASD